MERQSFCDVVGGRVPDFIRLSRYKRGFDVEQARWINEGLGASIRDGLNANWSSVSDYAAPRINIDQAFSDQQLGVSRTAFTEAVTLLWLASQQRAARPAALKAAV